ncbi:BamA/TamA family outer membrane protein [Formosa sp. A9]|uniref:BamA/TamA family outer membrane protein n=1 Tax=Formosa sp. A9 TaxID=3442641 RepID=UPI003EB9432B
MPFKHIAILTLLCLSYYTNAQHLYLNVAGETDTETERLDSIWYPKKHMNLQSAQHALDTLSQQLNYLGYIEHTRTPLQHINDSTLTSRFKLKTQYNSIKIFYNDSLLNTETLKSISTNSTEDYFIVAFKDLEKSLNHLNIKLSEHGNPFIKLKLEDISIHNKIVTAQLKTVTVSKPRQIDNIIIKGYEKFPEKFIKHYLKLKTGTVFNLNTIRKKTERLNELPFANQIRDPEVLFTEDSTTLYIYVEKIKSNSFDGYLGFTTNENTNKLEFSGYLDMLLQNNLNFGESLKLNYRSDENDQRNFNLKLDAPYLFKSPIGVQAELNIFKKDSSFTTTDQNLKLYYQFNPKHKMYLGLNSTQSNNLLTTNNTTITDYNSTFFETQYDFTNRTVNTQLFPIKTYATTQVGFGDRTIRQSKQKQTRLTAKAYHSFYLNAKNSIYTKIEAAALLSDNYLDNELFRFGGINSIRGFEENSLVANLYGVLNLEYRLQLNPTIYIHTISDFGYLENQIFTQKEKLLGLGVGFAILTKAGLLKFNYANGQTEKQPFNISNSKIHLSITSFF